jgi:hypothetical protein
MGAHVLEILRSGIYYNLHNTTPPTVVNYNVIFLKEIAT